ncbi:MAG: hypothetical protein AAGC56_02320 [Pseudomonadota bacterium]
MVRKDLRKEQVSLLRFEKQIAASAAALAALQTSAQAAEMKLDGAALEAYADLQSAMLNLADVTTRVHESLNAKAEELGCATFQAWGVPKDPPKSVVSSILGLG